VPHAQQYPAGPGAASGYGTPAAIGEPEYFGAPTAHASTGLDPYDDNPGHTRAFSVGDPPDSYGSQAQGDDNDDQDHVATYRAGQAATPPVGPRLRWKELIKGIILRPTATFWQMRDYPVWGPAVTVTFLYGLLVVFGFDSARQDVLNATTSSSVPWVLSTAVAVIISGLMLGAVTNALARQFGGDGAWAPTIGLAMLITAVTDAPRLLFAIFLGGGNSFVQVLGWATWIACAALLTSMVSKSHDLPWRKALGAASVQLIALLVLFKLPVI
jgi:Yip1 domain